MLYARHGTKQRFAHGLLIDGSRYFALMIEYQTLFQMYRTTGLGLTHQYCGTSRHSIYIALFTCRLKVVDPW